MKVTKVCCQGCGADLQVDADVHYVTCNYCHARLEVVHDTSVTHTRLMERLEKKTNQMAENLKVIALQNDLERLDREWAGRRESFMTTGKNGQRSVATKTGSVVGGVIAAGFGIFWIGMASSIGAPGPLILFGVIFVGFAIFRSISSGTKASRYETEEATHRLRRSELIQQIEAARGH